MPSAAQAHVGWPHATAISVLLLATRRPREGAPTAAHAHSAHTPAGQWRHVEPATLALTLTLALALPPSPLPSPPAWLATSSGSPTPRSDVDLKGVAFELEDGVALQNMYDIARAIYIYIYIYIFADVPGQTLSDADLVRNLLLGGIEDEEERADAYEDYWRPLEERHGDGAPAPLEAFLAAYPTGREVHQAHGSDATFLQLLPLLLGRQRLASAASRRRRSIVRRAA